MADDLYVAKSSGHSFDLVLLDLLLVFDTYDPSFSKTCFSLLKLTPSLRVLFFFFLLEFSPQF
jgi:hypothetical protein